MSILDLPEPLVKRSPSRWLLALSMLACLSPFATRAQDGSVLDESDAILGKKPAASSSDSPAGAAAGVGVADARAIMLFHPLMQHLVTTYGNSPMLYFLPPTASELTKLFDERRARRLVEVRAEMTVLAEQTAKLQGELLGLKDELNRRLGTSDPEPSKLKASEEGFWKRKQELTQRLASMNERYGALNDEVQNPLKLLEQTRTGIVSKMRREVEEEIARVAEARGLGVVINAYSPSREPVPEADLAAPEPSEALGGNEYKDFMNSKPGTDKVEPAMPLKRLLLLWEARAPRIETVFGLQATRTVLYGGTDITWPVLERILARYNVGQAQVSLLRAHFQERAQR